MDDDAFDPEPVLSRLARAPDDGAALADLAEACRRRLAADALPPESLDLARSVENLLGRLLDGAVAPTAATARLLGEAWSSFATPEKTRFGNLMERLDLVASGMDAELDDRSPQSAPRPPEPPLLTVRHDGARVTLGAFEDPPASHPADAQPRPKEYAETDPATMLACVVARLRRQIEALQAAAGPDLAPLASELSATVAEVDQLTHDLAAQKDEGAAFG